MPFFQYKAVTEEGKTVEASLEAETKEDLGALLRAKSLVLVEANVAGEEKATGLAFLIALNNKVKLLTGRVRDEEKVVFARNMGAMIAAGLPLSRALSVMIRQSNNVRFKKVLSGIEDSIRTGSSFHEALRKEKGVFSDLFTSMVEAGEESGTLADTLKILANRMERSVQLRKKIKGAMIYPAVIITAMIAIAILMMIFVVPTLASTFSDLGVELPRSTRVVIGISTFLSQHTLVALVLIAAAVFGVIFGLRSKLGREAYDWVVLHLPVIKGLVKEVNAARTASTLSSLLSAGVEVVRAVDITLDVVQNGYYKSILSDLRERIQKGETMSAVFAENEDLYPAFVGEMTMVGEETGQLPELLNRVAEYYETDVEQKTKDLSTIIEPVLMIVIGAAVGFFAVSMITPMYSLTSTI